MRNSTANLEGMLRSTGIVPVITISNEKRAIRLAHTLLEGGITAAEVTFRTEAAAAAIYKMREAYPELLVGAGTILTLEALDAALCSGAQFIVSPGLNPAIVEAAMERDVPVIPGCMTPTEIEQAMALGLDFVKFFPAEAAGGVKFLKAVAASYRSIRFMPTGGITPENAADYLALPSVVCCGASFIASDEQLEDNRFEEIAENVKRAKTVVDSVR